jgi:hypothetical protein
MGKLQPLRGGFRQRGLAGTTCTYNHDPTHLLFLTSLGHPLFSIVQSPGDEE